MTTEAALQNLETHRQKLDNGDLPVQPGQPAAFTAAATPNDVISQGDVRLCVLAKTPTEGFERVTDFSRWGSPATGFSMQLAIGNTRGSRHVLAFSQADLDAGLEIYLPYDWESAGYEGYEGPVLKTGSTPVEVAHPTHGNVTIADGLTVACDYQRNLDVEQQRERRAQD